MSGIGARRLLVEMASYKQKILKQFQVLYTYEKSVRYRLYPVAQSIMIADLEETK